MSAIEFSYRFNMKLCMPISKKMKNNMINTFVLENIRCISSKVTEENVSLRKKLIKHVDISVKCIFVSMLKSLI